MREKLKRFLGSYKFRAIMNLAVSVLCLVAGARVYGAHGDRAVMFMMFINAVIFAFCAGSAFSDHFSEKIISLQGDINSAYASVVRAMRERLNEQDMILQQYENGSGPPDEGQDEEFS